MPDYLFNLGVCFLIIGALVSVGQIFLHIANRSDLYSQERYDKAFREIVKREKQLQKQKARRNKLEDANGI